MSSILDNSLVDQLVPLVDELRSDLMPEMGIRQYAVYLVRRRWSGVRRGAAGTSPTIISDVLMDPPPRVIIPNNEGALHYEMTEAGRQEEGLIQLTEISLFQFTEADLTGSPIGPNEEFYYRVVDAHGQSIKTRYYVLESPPTADREKDIGWTLFLKRAEIEE